MKKQKLIIAVSGINAVDNPGPGIGVARSLKEDTELNVTLVGLGYDAMEPGMYMDWLMDKVYILPYPSSKPEAFLERLLYIKNSYGLDFIFPNLDSELPFYIQYKDVLEEHGIKTFLPSSDQFKLRAKDQLALVAEKMKIQLPKTVLISSYDELMPALENFTLPVMVKGLFYKANRAHTLQEVIAHFHHIVAEWGLPILIQEIVSGNEMNVVSVGDGEGGSLGSVAIKKMWITSLGKIWTGVTVKHPAMQKAVDRFLKEFHWKSAFELECIVQRDTIFLIEINPRFPAWSYFATGVGINLPSNIIRKVFDLPLLESQEYDAGKLYVRFTYDLVTDMDPFQKITTCGEK